MQSINQQNIYTYVAKDILKTFYFFHVILVTLILGILLALQPAFYPLEAEHRGIEPAGYGFVFALPNLAQLIFLPIFCKHAPRIGIKFCVVLGCVIETLCGYLFGFVAYVQSAQLFIALSALLRFCQGFGSALSRSSGVLVLSGIYPDKVM